MKHGIIAMNKVETRLIAWPDYFLRCGVILARLLTCVSRGTLQINTYTDWLCATRYANRINVNICEMGSAKILMLLACFGSFTTFIGLCACLSNHFPANLGHSVAQSLMGTALGCCAEGTEFKTNYRTDLVCAPVQWTSLMPNWVTGYVPLLNGFCWNFYNIEPVFLASIHFVLL